MRKKTMSDDPAQGRNPRPSGGSLPVSGLCPKTRILIAAGLAVLAIIPILLTDFPPSTDLPQHLAQARLFFEAVDSPGGPYVIQRFAPNILIDAVILLFWSLLPVDWVGQAVLVFLVLFWMASISFLAGRAGRPIEGAILASTFVFNQAFYWGFLNFLVGFPVFVLWFIQISWPGGNGSARFYGRLAGTSFLLYFSHVLWLGAGAAWLVLSGLLKRIPLRELFYRLATLIPCGVAALFWYPQMSRARAASGFDLAPHWSPLYERLSGFVDGAFGGIRGLLEIVILVFLFAWCGLSLWQNRKRFRGSVDWNMLAAAGFFLFIIIFAPDKFMNTILFGTRWLPIALIFILLALPSPSLPRLSSKVIAGTVAVVFFGLTTIAWHRYEAEDLTGLRESLAKIPPSSRVLGLDFVQTSEVIKGRPFLQVYAYAQVFQTCELNFSFAEHHSGLVAYKTKRDIPWTPGLEWSAASVKKADFGFFDVVLINARDAEHRRYAALYELLPVTVSGRWRLYAVPRR